MNDQHSAVAIGIDNPWTSSVWLAVWGIVASAVVSAFFWWLSEKSKDLAFAVSPTRADIVRSGLASDLTVLYKGSEISGNLSVIQLGVWNKGRDPIRQPDDILRAITIKPAPGMKVLEAKVVSATREELKFSIAPAEANGDMVLNWRILQKGDGALVQLLVVNAPDEPITVSGTIVGQGALEARPFGGRAGQSSSAALVTPSVIAVSDGISVRRIAAWLLIGLMTCFWVALGIYVYRNERARDPKHWKSAAVRLAVLVCLCAGFLTMVYHLGQRVSPFGF